jgi:MSHA type pilus biogenesis protein MshL
MLKDHLHHAKAGTSLRHTAFALALSLLSGCSFYRPEIPPSQGHITAPQVPLAAIPPPVKTTGFVPPPKPMEKPATYSVVVTEVPAKELLFALARDSKMNIDVHPAISGRVTLNAIDEPLPAILDRIARQVDMRYSVEGNTLIIVPDTPYLKTYPVNYVNLTRQTSSFISVATQIESTGTGAITGSTSARPTGGAAANGSTTTVTGQSVNDFWSLIGQNIANILSSTRALKLSTDEKAARAEAERFAREERVKQTEAASRAGPGAAALFSTAFSAAPGTSADAKQDIVVNPVAGTVSVLASEKQHALIGQYLDSIAASVERQVLIEATIVEVRLSDAFQSGVDWSRLAGLSAGSTGFRIAQSLLAGTQVDSVPNLTLGYLDKDAGIGNISITVKLLEQFGATRVLSSPKVMALNNQTALLKVVDNVVYFNVQAQQGIVTTTGVVQPPVFTTTPQTVPVGLVMAVTPQIDERKSVILNVRPTVTRVTRFVPDPNPDLARAGVTNLVPEIQAREMESVLKVGSGQTVILGGLMQDDVARNRDGIPWLSTQPVVGDFFSFRDEAVAKTELVIFLRPIVVPNPTLASDELKFFQRFLPEPAQKKR